MTQTVHSRVGSNSPGRLGGAKAGGPRRNRRSMILTVVMALMLIYALVPVMWLLISATKTQGELFSTPGLWFGPHFALWDNIGETVTYQNGVFLRWFGNTILYVVIGAGAATLLATAGGYGLAKHRFPGRRAVFAIVLGAVAVPGTALAVPTFLLFSTLGLTNTIWSVIIPSMITPFGLYLMWVYAEEAIPSELLEAARLDGAGEIRIFFAISIRLLGPGIVTVLISTMVGTWNNYFLPLIMLTNPKLYPLTVGLNQWNAQAQTNVGNHPIYNLVLTGSLLTIVPLVVAFLLLQRYWQSGLTSGAVKS